MIKRRKEINMSSGLVGIGDCFSGLFHPRDNSAFRRIHLITPSALERFSDHATLHQTVRGFVTQEVLRAEIFRLTGLVPEVFRGRGTHLTIGLRTAAVAYEKDLMESAKEILCSQRPGVHRQIYFRMMGIDIPDTVAGLRPDRYATMLAKLFLVDPSLESIGLINFREQGPHDLGGEATPRMLTFSIEQLEKGPQWSHVDKESFLRRFVLTET
jgi:hypothetical protein